MTYDVLDVSRHIINYSNQRDYIISNLKLQKLLYFTQIMFLTGTENNAPCFDDKIEAWDCGVIVPKAYSEFKRFGIGHIPTIKSYLVFDKNDIWNTIERKPVTNDIIQLTHIHLINAVVDRFKNFNLTDMNHLIFRQKPFKDAYAGNRIITNESLLEYFSTSKD